MLYRFMYNFIIIYNFIILYFIKKFLNKNKEENNASFHNDDTEKEIVHVASYISIKCQNEYSYRNRK